MPYKDPKSERARASSLRACRKYNAANRETRNEDSRRRYRNNPAKHIEAASKWNAAHPERTRENQRRSYSPARKRDYDLRRKFGITLADVERMKDEQHHRCAICLHECPAPEPARWWNVDHCHSTGRVRAMLCTPCNRAFGMFKEDIITLKRAVLYVERHNPTELDKPQIHEILSP